MKKKNMNSWVANTLTLAAELSVYAMAIFTSSVVMKILAIILVSFYLFGALVSLLLSNKGFNKRFEKKSYLLTESVYFVLVAILLGWAAINVNIDWAFAFIFGPGFFYTSVYIAYQGHRPLFSDFADDIRARAKPRIENTALRIDGKIYTSSGEPLNHIDLVCSANDKIRRAGGEYEVGYMTSKNKFVDSYKALEIAKDAGQVKASENNTVLHFDMIW
jgi:hypothetical protein